MNNRLDIHELKRRYKTPEAMIKYLYEQLEEILRNNYLGMEIRNVKEFTMNVKQFVEDSLKVQVDNHSNFHLIEVEVAGEAENEFLTIEAKNFYTYLLMLGVPPFKAIWYKDCYKYEDDYIKATWEYDTYLEKYHGRFAPKEALQSVELNLVVDKDGNLTIPD